MKRIFGNILKIIRTSKNLSLKDVAGSGLSAAQLSRFERGLTTISVDSFYGCLRNLNMDLAEFQLLYSQMTDSPDASYPGIFSQIYTEQEEEGLRRLLSKEVDFLTEEPDNQYHHLNQIVLKIQLSDETVTDQEVSELSDYLFSVDEWGNYEVSLFVQALPVLSSQTIEVFGNELMNRTHLHRDIPESRRVLTQALSKLIVYYFDQDQLHYVFKYISFLESLNYSENEAYERILVKYFKALYAGR